MEIPWRIQFRTGGVVSFSVFKGKLLRFLEEVRIGLYKTCSLGLFSTK